MTPAIFFHTRIPGSLPVPITLSMTLMDFLPTPFPFLLKGTHTAVKAKRDLDAANLRPAGLRKANAGRYEIIFQSEFAICS